MVWQAKTWLWMDTFSTRPSTVFHWWVLLLKRGFFLELFNDKICVYLCVCEQGHFIFFSTGCKHSCSWAQKFISFHRQGSLDEVAQCQIFRIASFYYNSVTVKHRMKITLVQVVSTPELWHFSAHLWRSVRSWAGCVVQHSAWQDDQQPWIHGPTWGINAIDLVAISARLPGLQQSLQWLCLVVGSLSWPATGSYNYKEKICSTWAFSPQSLSIFHYLFSFLSLTLTCLLNPMK